MAGEYRKDLSHTTWEHVYARQAMRAALVDDYWRLARGRPGFRVADVGSGPGFFTLRLAALTGPTGHVHAVDVSEDALAHLCARLDPVHHAHVTTETLDVARHPLPGLRFDALLCTDMLHHADEPARVLANLRQANARLVVAEFDPEGPGEMGPPRKERIAPADLIAMLRDAGWAPGPAMPLAYEHYAVVATPASASEGAS